MKTLHKSLKILLVFFSIFIFLVLSILLAIQYSKWEASQIQMVFHVEKRFDIPKDFDDKKIVFISDFHNDDQISSARIEKMVGLVNQLNPDIILLGGDYISGDPKNIQPTFEILKKLK